MNVVFYWWGFRVYVDDGFLHQLITALQGGSTGVSRFLSQQGLWWLSPAAPLIVNTFTSAITNWGINALRSTDSGCGHRGCSLTIPWTVWSSYTGCR